MSYDGKPADRTDHERFPTFEARYGYDAGRFLDQDLLEDGSRHTTSSNRHLVRAVIRGLPSVERCRAWAAVERQLATRQDREPREPILEWLDEREAELEQQGDLDERLAIVPDRDERVEQRSAADYEAMPTVTPMPPCARLWGSPSERLAETACRRGE